MNEIHVSPIDKYTALDMVKRYHYSDTLPKINRYFLGAFLDGELVGVVTLGYGTRPLHTIRRIFPSLDTEDYLEIGRMCMTDAMPRNSETKMLSRVVHWLRQHSRKTKVLFTWADGMLGKPGYVYQAASFLYAGYSITDIYSIDGIKIHPRAIKSILLENPSSDKRVTVRPTLEQMREFRISHYRGKQFRYLAFTCNKPEKRRLMGECLVSLSCEYPKQNALQWMEQDAKTGKWHVCNQPQILTDSQACFRTTNQLKLF